MDLELIASAEEFDRVWNPEMEIANTSRVIESLKCGLSFENKYIHNLIPKREIDDVVSYELAQRLGIALHQRVHDVAIGIDTTDIDTLDEIEELFAIANDAGSEKTMDKIVKASAWLHAVLPVVTQRRDAHSLFSRADEVVSSELCYGIYDRDANTMWVGIVDQMVMANDALWARECKSVASNKKIVPYAKSMTRGPQITWERMVAVLLAARLKVPSVGGAILDCYVKRSVPTDPTTMTLPKSAVCETCDGTLEGSRNMHTARKNHEKHVSEMQTVRANFERRREKATFEWAAWPSLVFHREPLIDDNLMRSFVYWMRTVAGVYHRKHMNTNSCYVYTPCDYNDVCPLDPQAIGGDRWTTRPPDYVDVLRSGVWPHDPREPFAWADEGEFDEAEG